jgi:hypothetical protein
MFATDLVEGMRDQSKFFEEIFVIVFSYGINDYGNDIKRKNGRHCGMLDAERGRRLDAEPRTKSVRFLLGDSVSHISTSTTSDILSELI